MNKDRNNVSEIAVFIFCRERINSFRAFVVCRFFQRWGFALLFLFLGVSVAVAATGFPWEYVYSLEAAYGTINSVKNDPTLSAGKQIMDNCIKKHESGGTAEGKSKANADYYFVNEQGQIEKAGVAGNGGGGLRACPEGTKNVTCLPMSAGSNQNNYVHATTARLALNFLKTNGYSTSGLMDPSSVTNMQQFLQNGHNIANACAGNSACEGFMSDARMSANTIAAYNYMKNNGITPTASDWVYYGQLANWMPACMSQVGGLSPKCQEGFDRFKSWFQQYGGDCGSGNGSTPTPPPAVDQDVNSPTYGKPLQCVDADLMGKLNKSNRAYENAVLINAGDKTYKSVLKGQAEAQKKRSDGKTLRGDVTKCISVKYKDYFSGALSLLEGLEAFILDMIKSLVETLLEKLCQVVVDSINALLNMICIPMPDLNLGFGLDSLGMDSRTCDGLSLANVISVTGGSWDGSALAASISDPSSYAANAITTEGIKMPNIFQLLSPRAETYEFSY